MFFSRVLFVVLAAVSSCAGHSASGETGRLPLSQSVNIGKLTSKQSKSTSRSLNSSTSESDWSPRYSLHELSAPGLYGDREAWEKHNDEVHAAREYQATYGSRVPNEILVSEKTQKILDKLNAIDSAQNKSMTPESRQLNQPREHKDANEKETTTSNMQPNVQDSTPTSKMIPISPRARATANKSTVEEWQVQAGIFAVVVFAVLCAQLDS